MPCQPESITEPARATDNREVFGSFPPYKFFLTLSLVLQNNLYYAINKGLGALVILNGTLTPALSRDFAGEGA